MGDVTVNGAPLSEFIDKERKVEIEDVRKLETKGRKKPIVSKRDIANHSKTRHGAVEAVYTRGQKETHVIILGHVFPWELKAPYVRSGKSLFGATEYNQELDQLKCHECGEWYESLGYHVSRGHKMSASEYKSKHGMARSRSLIGARTRRQRSMSVKNKRSGEATRFRSGHEKLGWGRGKQPGVHNSPELANVRGRCKAQLLQKLLTLGQELGRTPKAREIAAHVAHHGVIEFSFGMKVRDVLVSLGMNPDRRRGTFKRPTKAICQ